MWKKFLSVILSVLMFICPLSIFAAGTNQFEEVCNFYDYANRELISSNSDPLLTSASEKFSKYYNQASEYIEQHPDDLDPNSDLGKILQAESYFNSPENNSWEASIVFNDYAFDLIKNILFLKQTLLYLKNKDTNVFGTDNIEELNSLGDAVAYLEGNLPEIIYDIEESLIEYIKSLPLSNTVKEDMEREILRTQVVDFGFLRSYDYLYGGFSLNNVTLIDKDATVEDNIKNVKKIKEELNTNYINQFNLEYAAKNPCTANAINTWDLNIWENPKYMDTTENFVILFTPIIIPFTLNGQDLESDIINLSETLGHEFGHLVQRYSPANIDYYGGQYSATDISSAYRSKGIWVDNQWSKKEKYDKDFTDILEESKKDNNIYSSKLQSGDADYFDDLRNRIKNHFESMSLENVGYSETERMNGEAIYDEVFSDIYGLNTAMNYIRLYRQTDLEKLFRVCSQLFYEKSFEVQEPNEAAQQTFRELTLHSAGSCSYPTHGSNRVNGVLTMIPEYVEWAKPKANAYRPEFSATDEDTGVQIQADMGKLIDGVSLNVNKLNKDTDAYKATFSNVDDNIKDQIENIDIYSVSVVDRNGNTVQPKDGVGLVKLRIPIPQGFDKSDLSALYIAYGNYNDEISKGNIVNLNGTDYFEFEVTHFSDYSLVDQLTTYEKMFWPIVFSVVALAVIATSIVLYNKKKKTSLSSK